MNYTDERMEKLHGVLLEIFEYIKDVCEQNDLTYLVIAGTALGAYRHGGFIPWDDDLDIALPRGDYEKLLKILHDIKHPLYEIQDESNEKGYFLPFVKVRKKNTVFREAVAPFLYERNGIFIDIFPIDTEDRIDTFDFKMRSFLIKLLNHALCVKNCREYYKDRRSRGKYLVDRITSLPFCFFSNRKLLHMQKKLMTARNHKSAIYAVNYASTYSINKEAMPYEVYFPVKKITFEGKETYSYGNIENYLTRIYGNYMELPPEEKRHTHEPFELKF